MEYQNIFSRDVRPSENPSYNSVEILITLGWLGIALPFVLFGANYLFSGCIHPLPSISAYYHSYVGGILCGVLGAFGLSMLYYRGYDSGDSIFSSLAGLCAIGIAVFPTTVNHPGETCIPDDIDLGLIGNLHLVFTVLFFVLLVLLVVYKFTISREIWLKTFFWICGIIMIASMVLIVLWFNGT